jgi:hypothetical protein
MKTVIAAAAGGLLLAIAAPAAASPASREFNRGYYDCLAGRFDEEGQTHPYREGCRAAKREREGEGAGGWDEGPPRHRPPPAWGGDEGAAPNVARPVGVPNVKGMEPAQVLAAMASLGYRNVGTEVAGAAIYGFYFNPVTGECVQVANMNGRAIGAVPVGSNPRCR